MQPFTSTSHAVRLHAGTGALGNLPREVKRVGARRAFVICGRSVATRTPLLQQVASLLEGRYAGAYTYLSKNAPLAEVVAAAEQAEKAGADALIAIGAGSVIKATRVVAILLAESGPPESLCTQYPENGPPISPRLSQPKLPIFNILTAATSAQNRGGAALKHPHDGPRLEFFDPKTRPTAIFWDEQALLSAPPSLALSTGVGVFWRALMNVAAIKKANPLVQASRLHAFALARAALPGLRDPAHAQARMDMCAAALLQNRDEDDGGRPFDAHWIARTVYAVGAALFNQVEHLDQGLTHAVLTGPAIRHFGHLCPDTVSEIAAALGLTDRNQPACPEETANAVDAWFRGQGLSLRLCDAPLRPETLHAVIENATKNFNADRHRELAAHSERLEAMLRDVF